MVNYKRWSLVTDEIDAQTYTRFLSGRITKRRFQTVLRYARLINYHLSAPYGISPRGYAYSCGCSHDCCGCLCSARLSMSYCGDEILLVLQLNYNY